MKECRTLSLANLVAHMEKEKSKLRKLKRRYRNKRKQDEAWRINKLFQLDPEREFLEFENPDTIPIDKIGNGCLVILRRPRDIRSLCGSRRE